MYKIDLSTMLRKGIERMFPGLTEAESVGEDMQTLLFTYSLLNVVQEGQNSLVLVIEENTTLMTPVLMVRLKESLSFDDQSNPDIQVSNIANMVMKEESRMMDINHDKLGYSSLKEFIADLLGRQPYHGRVYKEQETFQTYTTSLRECISSKIMTHLSDRFIYFLIAKLLYEKAGVFLRAFPSTMTSVIMSKTDDHAEDDQCLLYSYSNIYLYSDESYEDFKRECKIDSLELEGGKPKLFPQLKDKEVVIFDIRCIDLLRELSQIAGGGVMEEWNKKYIVGILSNSLGVNDYTYPNYATGSHLVPVSIPVVFPRETIARGSL